jgi:hypothetical protein
VVRGCYDGTSKEKIKMERKWATLSAEEKREERFRNWLSPRGVEFISSKAETWYQQRVQRIIDAIKLKEPDKVPVNISMGFLPAFYSGLTIEAVMYDDEKMRDAWIKFINGTNLDDFDTFDAGGALPGRVYEILDLKSYKWPGHGVPPNSTLQYVEREYMKADEYEHYLEDPSDFQMRVYLPRVMGALAPFQKLLAFRNIGTAFIYNLGIYGTPEVRAAFNALFEAGEEVIRWQKVAIELNRRILAEGFPPFFAGRAGTPPEAPFDALSNHYRGTLGIMTDMYRQPDKLLEALEKVTRMAVRRVASIADSGGSPIIFMGLHKGADGFMPEQQFTTFYWPFLKRVVLSYIEEGFVPCLFAEGGYNSRLEIVKELPKGKVIWHFDQTDMARAKKVLGDSQCIMGNVPATLLVTGTPGEVKGYCKKLIAVAGKGGGYILAPGAGTNEAKLENFYAVVAAAKEYGRY